MKDIDPMDTRGRGRDRFHGWAEAWARLNDIYAADGTLDIERANRQLEFLAMVCMDQLRRAMDNNHEIARAIAELVVGDHERLLHGRKDVH